jgi:asparagine synthase (glutamine-hydrolysing)
VFLLSLTRSGLRQRFGSLRVAEFRCGEVVATAATDENSYRQEHADAGVSIIETLGVVPGATLLLSRVRYDAICRTLTIRRTTLAGTPIYYHLGAADDFYCASHICLLRAAGVSICADDLATPELLVYNYVTPPRTLYEQIRQVPSGGTLRVSVGRTGYTFDLPVPHEPPTPARERPDAEAVALQTLQLIETSMSKLGQARNRTAVLLSGGLDSSVLYKVAHDRLGVSRSHSTGYPFHSSYENVEKDYALTAAAAMGSDHTYHEVTVEDMQRAIVKAIALAEEPLVYPQAALLSLLFAQGLSPHEEIVVSGQGAALFGLPAHLVYAWNHADAGPWRLRARAPIFGLLKAFTRDTPANRILLSRLSQVRRRALPFSDPQHPLWEFGAEGSEEWVVNHLSTTREEIIGGRREFVRPHASRGFNDLVTILAFFGETPAMEGVWSKVAQATGRTMFYPFNDETIVDHMFAVPWEVKLTEAKAVLKDVARLLEIPTFIIDRPKSGFGVRPRQIAEPGGLLEPLIPLASKALDGLNLRAMQRSDDRHVSQTLWNLVNYGIWKRTVIDGEDVDVLLEEAERLAATWP